MQGTELITKSAAYIMGHDAYKSWRYTGGPAPVNPYDPDWEDQEYSDWDRGYLDASFE